MKIVLQRVNSASVLVENKTVGEIEKGFLLLLGVCNEDTKDDALRLIKKIAALRIFADENGKTNLSLADVNGSLLIVSQFTLYADCKKGNRPSFVKAGSPEYANELYEYFVSEAKKLIPNVQTGIFGADMKISLVNDGPFTLILE